MSGEFCFEFLLSLLSGLGEGAELFWGVLGGEVSLAGGRSGWEGCNCCI